MKRILSVKGRDYFATFKTFAKKYEERLDPTDLVSGKVKIPVGELPKL